jgi:hypothetical protein
MRAHNETDLNIRKKVQLDARLRVAHVRTLQAEGPVHLKHRPSAGPKRYKVSNSDLKFVRELFACKTFIILAQSFVATQTAIYGRSCTELLSKGAQNQKLRVSKLEFEVIKFEVSSATVDFHPIERDLSGT